MPVHGIPYCVSVHNGVMTLLSILSCESASHTRVEGAFNDIMPSVKFYYTIELAIAEYVHPFAQTLELC